MVSVVELVDTPDCGSGAAALRVQVSSLTPEIWKSGRVADGTILERWRTERFRGFESHFFLHIYIGESHSGDCTGLQNRRLQTIVGSSPTSPAIVCSLRETKTSQARFMRRCVRMLTHTRRAVLIE